MTPVFRWGDGLVLRQGDAFTVVRSIEITSDPIAISIDGEPAMTGMHLVVNGKQKAKSSWAGHYRSIVCTHDRYGLYVTAWLQNGECQEVASAHAVLDGARRRLAGFDKLPYWNGIKL